MHCVIKMKHGTKKRLKVNIMYAYVRARKGRVLISRQRVLTWGATRPYLGATRPRVGICLSRLDALTSKYNTFSYCQVGASTPNLAMPTRGRVAPK